MGRAAASLTLVVLVLSACGGGPAAAMPSGGGAQTVTYCTDGGIALTLDMYEPPHAAGRHPLLVFAHGGSWAFGSSSLAEQSRLVQGVVSGALSAGFAVASLNYRLAPAHPWPAQVVDVRCALAYLRASAARWDVDPARIEAMGNSAGAQLVSLAALSAGQVAAWDPPGSALPAPPLAGVVDLWGPADLLAPGWSQEAIDIGRVVFAVSWGTQDPTLAQASPVTYVHPGAPPFLIVQGLADTLVPPAQSRELRDRLVAAGDQATLVEVAHAGHELIPSGGAISPGVGSLTAQVLAFIAAAARPAA